jgi:hypothetical protein
MLKYNIGKNKIPRGGLKVMKKEYVINLESVY